MLFVSGDPWLADMVVHDAPVHLLIPVPLVSSALCIMKEKKTQKGSPAVTDRSSSSSNCLPHTPRLKEYGVRLVLVLSPSSI